MELNLNKTAHYNRTRGFTLIELLVVIAIISMLLSIVTPSLNNAKESGRRVVCLSALKQLTLAWYMYADENDGELCSPDTLWNDGTYSITNHWVAEGPAIPGNNIWQTETSLREGVLWPYLETAGIYKCKSHRMDVARSYAISSIMGDYNSYCSCPTRVQRYYSINEINRTSGKLVFADVNHGPMGTIDSGNGGPFTPIKLSTGEWTGTDLTLRHMNGCNLSFVDLHCDYYKYKDQKTIRMINNELSGVNPSENNLDLKIFLKYLTK